jgi:two-component system cell cycle sensor histidine kinase/response regulator CckA
MMDPIKTLSPLHILLVEDNKHDRLAFRRAFQDSQVSWEITEYERAEEALERLRTDASSFNLAVIDHGLPGMSGLELCKQLLDEETPVPLVILTGTGSEQLAVEALKAGVYDYMIKTDTQGYLDLLPVVLPEVLQKHGDRLARKRAEEALRESEERFRKIVEGSEAGYFFVDRGGCIRDVNEAWLQMHGYSSREEVIGQHVALTQVDKDMEQTQRQFEDLFSGKPIPSGESTRRLKDGSIGYHTFSANPVVKGGKIVGVEAFLIDITERRQAEEELLKLSHAMKQSPSAIMITDSHGVIEYVNPKFKEITGYTSEEAIGTSAANLGEQPPEEERQMWDMIWSIPCTTHLALDWRGEFYKKKKNGEDYWELASISAIRNKDGLITHFVKVSEDITDLKRAEEALRESEKQLYRDQRRMEILQFANDVALKLMDELIDPVTAIGGFSKLISSRGYPDNKLTEYARIIFEESMKVDNALHEALVNLQAAAEEAAT